MTRSDSIGSPFGNSQLICKSRDANSPRNDSTRSRNVTSKSNRSTFTGVRCASARDKASRLRTICSICPANSHASFAKPEVALGSSGQSSALSEATRNSDTGVRSSCAAFVANRRSLAKVASSRFTKALICPAIGCRSTGSESTEIRDSNDSASISATSAARTSTGRNAVRVALRTTNQVSTSKPTPPATKPITSFCKI